MLDFAPWLAKRSDTDETTKALQDFASGLGPLGTPKQFTQVRQGLRGGMVLRVYLLRFEQQTLRAWTYELPNGKLEQYQIAVQN